MIFYHRPLIGQLTATRMGRNNTSKDMDKSIEINFKEPSPKAQVNWKEKTMRKSSSIVAMVIISMDYSTKKEMHYKDIT